MRRRAAMRVGLAALLLVAAARAALGAGDDLPCNFLAYRGCALAEDAASFRMFYVPDNATLYTERSPMRICARLAVARGAPLVGLGMLATDSVLEPDLPYCFFFPGEPARALPRTACDLQVRDGVEDGRAGRIRAAPEGSRIPYEGPVALYRASDVYPEPPARAPECARLADYPRAGLAPEAVAPAGPALAPAPPAHGHRVARLEGAAAASYAERGTASGVSAARCALLAATAPDGAGAEWRADDASCAVWSLVPATGPVGGALVANLSAVLAGDPAAVHLRPAAPALPPREGRRPLRIGCVGLPVEAPPRGAAVLELSAPFPLEQLLRAGRRAGAARVAALARLPGTDLAYVGVLLPEGGPDAARAFFDPLPPEACGLERPVESRWGPAAVGGLLPLARRGRVLVPFAAYDLASEAEGGGYAGRRVVRTVVDGAVFRRDAATDCGTLRDRSDCAGVEPAARAACSPDGCLADASPREWAPELPRDAPERADEYAEYAPGLFAAERCAGVPCYDEANPLGVASCHPARGCFTAHSRDRPVSFEHRNASLRAPAPVPANVTVPCDNLRTGARALCAIACAVPAQDPHARPAIRAQRCPAGRRSTCGPAGCVPAPDDRDPYSFDETAARVPATAPPSGRWPADEGSDEAGVYRWVDATDAAGRTEAARTYLFCFRRDDLGGAVPLACPEPDERVYGCDPGSGACVPGRPRFAGRRPAAPAAPSLAAADAGRPCLDGSVLATCRDACPVEPRPGEVARVACPPDGRRYACDALLGCVPAPPARPDATLLDVAGNPSATLVAHGADGSATPILGAIACLSEERDRIAARCPVGDGYAYECRRGACVRALALEAGLYGTPCTLDGAPAILDGCGVCGGSGGDACGGCDGACEAPEAVAQMTLVEPLGPAELRRAVARAAGLSSLAVAPPTYALPRPALPVTVHVGLRADAATAAAAVRALHASNATFARGFRLVVVDDGYGGAPARPGGPPSAAGLVWYAWLGVALGGLAAVAALAFALRPSARSRAKKRA